jgi:WD40 repeat protein
MSVVGNPSSEIDRAVQHNYLMWNELPADVTCNQVLTLLDPLNFGKCRVVCTQWERFLTSDPVWKFLSRCYFPSMAPQSFMDFQACQRFNSNLLIKGVYSVKTLRGHATTLRARVHKVNSLALKGTALFSASDDRVIKKWNLETNTCEEALEEWHQLSVCSLALREGTLFSGSEDSTIIRWNLATNTCCTVTSNRHKHTDAVCCLASEDAMLISGSDDGTIMIWDSSTNAYKATLKGHNGKVKSLALRGKMLFSGSCDGTIKIWDLSTNTCIATLKEEGHDGGVFSLVLRGETLISGSGDGTIKIWDLSTNTCIATHKGHTGAVRALVLKDPMLFSGSDDGTIKIWDLSTNICIATLKDHAEWVRSLALAGTKLISGSYDGTIKIWDFTANLIEILTEIADVFEADKNRREVDFALARFSRMPESVKSKVLHEFGEIIKSEPDSDDGYAEDDFAYKGDCDDVKSELELDNPGRVEDAFYERNGQRAKQTQRGRAIKNYLNGLPK